MANQEMSLNSGFSCALPSLRLPYLEHPRYRRKTIQTFCSWMLGVRGGEETGKERRTGAI